MDFPGIFFKVISNVHDCRPLIYGPYIHVYESLVRLLCYVKCIFYDCNEEHKRFQRFWSRKLFILIKNTL